MFGLLQLLQFSIFSDSCLSLSTQLLYVCEDIMECEKKSIYLLLQLQYLNKNP